MALREARFEGVELALAEAEAEVEAVVEVLELLLPLEDVELLLLVRKMVIPWTLKGSTVILAPAVFMAAATSNFWTGVVFPGASREVTVIVVALDKSTYRKSLPLILAISSSMDPVLLPWGY